MADLLLTGSAWLHAKLSANAAHPVTYRRGEQTAQAMATVGRTPFRVEDGGVLLRIDTRDFIISADQLTAFGNPEDGDQIDETTNGVTVTHEMYAPAGEPPWRWSGPDRIRYRIHTQRISQQA
ncbi:MAG TPA: hypothetical protein DCS97_04080 [Planctomycetes bacterium]|nr:hypothetical protein [Planctomycetota bacterium]